MLPALLALLLALPAQSTEGVLGAPEEQVRAADEAGRAEATGAVADGGAPKAEDRVKFVGGDNVRPELRRRAIADSLAGFHEPRRRRAALDDAAYALELLYLAQGFPFVKVSVSLRDGPATSPADFAPDGDTTAGDVSFHVAEGPRTAIESVSFIGNAAFSDDELQELFRDRERGLLAPGLSWYSADGVNDALSTISAVYWSEGYLQVIVDPADTMLSDDRTQAFVTVTVHEGPAYRLRRAEFTGLRVFPEEQLRQQVADFLDRPYFPQVAFAARARLIEFYGERGHAEAVVDFEEVRDDATGDVGLLFRVEAGPKLSVSSVRIEGLERTRTEFLLQRLAFESGDTWSTTAQRESYEALHRSGLFEGISIELQPGRDDAREVAVSVQERTAREIYIEPGFGSYEKLRLSLGYRDRNVGGYGRILHAEGSVSSLAQSALVGLTDPWFGDDLTADVSVFANRREEPSFTVKNLGVAATLNLLLTPRWQTQFGYLFRRSSLSDVDVVDAEVDDALDDVNISSVSVSPIYDSRDDPFAPTTGMLWRTTVEYGGPVLGSELDFVRGGYTHSVFTPLGADSVLAASFRTGIIVPVAGTDVIPLQERYFNGGENTVRSYKEDELGPKDSDGNPIGGEAYSVFSVELRQTLTETFGAALFMDLGNVEEDASDYFQFSNGGMAIGAGLRYLLPIGPVRFDVGVNPDRGEDEDAWVAHLSVGAPF